MPTVNKLKKTTTTIKGLERPNSQGNIINRRWQAYISKQQRLITSLTLPSNETLTFQMEKKMFQNCKFTSFTHP